MNMKNITKIFSVLAVAGMAFASCIEEPVLQSSTATAEQVGASASALEASVNGIPSQMAQGYLVYGEQEDETDMAYPGLIIAQTEMLGDMFPLGSNTGYDWYRHYNDFESGMGYQYVRTYIPWRTQYMFVKTANDIIGTANPDDIDDIESLDAPDEVKGLAAPAYVSRAHAYYQLMTLYEAVKNPYTDCSKVEGLTVPIVTALTTAEQVKNNPRATHDEMVAFILSDLDKAEKCFDADTTKRSVYLPSKAVAYGMKARVYMWDKKYAEAAEYARKAIEESKCTPMTQAQYLDLNTGFNTANQAWMWSLHYDAENMGNLCNFTGWMSMEADWGYGSLTCPGIDKSLYDRIPKTDFRKFCFLDENKYDFYNYQTCRDAKFIKEKAPAMLSLKFRCVGGDWEDYGTGGACDVPVMRVEEMYLIEAEALGMSKGLEAGVEALNSFVKTYRNPEYACTAATERDFQLECMWQKRIETWGEGVAFADAKRLRPGSIQNYEGTNAPGDPFKINCAEIKPVWIMIIPRTEIENNNALQGKNNPDPTKAVVGPSPLGQYAEGKF